MPMAIGRRTRPRIPKKPPTALIGAIPTAPAMKPATVINATAPNHFNCSRIVGDPRRYLRMVEAIASGRTTTTSRTFARARSPSRPWNAGIPSGLSIVVFPSEPVANAGCRIPTMIPNAAIHTTQRQRRDGSRPSGK